MSKQIDPHVEQIMKLAATSQDKIQEMTERVVNGINTLDRLYREIQAEKKKEAFWGGIAKNLLPVLLVPVLIFSLHLMPCGTSIDIAGVQVAAPSCVSRTGP